MSAQWTEYRAIYDDSIIAKVNARVPHSTGEFVVIGGKRYMVYEVLTPRVTRIDNDYMKCIAVHSVKVGKVP